MPPGNLRAPATSRCLLVLVLAGLLAACTSGPGTVAGVSVEVPAGWQETSAPAAPAGVVAAGSWQSEDGTSTLQVIVGCGPGDVQDLAIAAITEPRPPLEVTDAGEVGEVDLPGTDQALELRFTLGTAGEAASVRVGGLYVAAEDSLVLVEISTPAGDPQRELVDTTLASVTVDRDEVADRCR